MKTLFLAALLLIPSLCHASDVAGFYVACVEARIGIFQRILQGNFHYDEGVVQGAKNSCLRECVKRYGSKACKDAGAPPEE